MIDKNVKAGINKRGLYFFCKDSKIFMFLQEAKVEMTLDEQGDTAMNVYCSDNKKELVEYCLKHGIDYMVPNKKGGTGLTYAAAQGHLDIFVMLINDLANKRSCTPAEVLNDPSNGIKGRHLLNLIASQRGRFKHVVDNMEWMVANGADVNAVDAEGMTALHRAAEANVPEYAEALLRLGADWTISRPNGIGPLQAAALRGNVEVLKKMLDM